MRRTRDGEWMRFVERPLARGSARRGIVPRGDGEWGSFWDAGSLQSSNRSGCLTASTVYGRYFLKNRPKTSVYRYETAPMMKKTCTQLMAMKASSGCAMVSEWMKPSDEEDTNEFFQISSSPRRCRP
ncbi:MAG: hypothetical protein MZV64_00250 [Ignavibacteriales bacterium]|nr:hypothetical protein [Ignavibacteriales bacterium]